MPEVEGTVVLVVEATVEAVVVDMMLAGLSGELSWFLSVFLTPGGSGSLIPKEATLGCHQELPGPR